MIFTKQEILDAFESRANLTRIDIEQIDYSFINRMAEGAEIVDFSTPELLDDYIDESLKIGIMQHKETA